MTMKYEEITTMEQWNDIQAKSAQRPQVILKHSTRCPVSAAALEEFEDYLNGKANEGVDYYMVKVIESRPVSLQIAEDSGVTHASPQIIMLKDKQPEWNTSHWSITKKHMTAVLD